MASGHDVFDRLYQHLVALCWPRHLRDSFGAEMREYFRTRRRDAASRGVIASVRFWLVTLSDLATTSLRERRPGANVRLASLMDDVRHGVRSARRAPALSLTIIALVALTTGATTSMFSVTNAVLLRDLPYGDPGRLVAIWEQRLATGSARNTVGAHEFPVWAARARTFEALAAFTYSDSAMHLTSGGDPVELFAARVTGRFFDVMGVPPLAGRAATPQDDVPGATPVAVLSERLWRQRFGGRMSVIGSQIVLNDLPHMVVGVMPDRLRFPDRGPHQPADLWVPIAEPIHLYRGRHYLFAVGRLQRDATLAQANAELESIAAAVAADLPAFSRDHSAHAWPLLEDRAAPARPWLLLLLAASACLAAIGCANIAGLLLARAERRRHDAQVRLALGASRARLARERLAESVIMSCAGGAVGLALTAVVARLAPAVVPADLWPLDTIPLDATVFAFAFGLSMLTGIAFGVAPSLLERRLGAAGASSNHATLRAARNTFRGALVVAQVALALVLTSGAGLFARSLAALHAVDPAFRTDDVLSADIALPPARYSDPARVRQFYTDLEAAVRALPDVEHVALVNHVPFGGSYDAIALTVEGAPPTAPGAQPSARYRIVSDGYFAALRIPIVDGRAFSSADARRALPLIRWYPQQPEPAFANAPQPAAVAIVNETMARTYWPGGAIDRRFKLLHSPWITVIGVAADTRADSLAANLRPEVYLLNTQEPAAGMSVLVAGSEPERHAAAIRAAVRELDPALPIGRVQSLESLLGAIRRTPAFTSVLVSCFAGTALLLMVCGVYGLLAYVTAARTPEIGLRVALGASRGSIRALVLRHVLTLLAIGVGLGVVISLWLAPSAGVMLFGVRPTDPLTLAAVAVIVIVVAMIAALVPAARAANIDPLRALRRM